MGSVQGCCAIANTVVILVPRVMLIEESVLRLVRRRRVVRQEGAPGFAERHSTDWRRYVDQSDVSG
jgi:hypothetical protein